MPAKYFVFFLLFAPSVAHSATVVKTWNFLSTTEGLADAGNDAILTFAANTSTGNPTNSVQFSESSKNTTRTEFARNSSTGETWETWGVPAGATINSIQITAWSETTDSTQLGVVMSSVSFRIIGSGGTSVTSGAGDPIDHISPGTGGDTVWNIMSAGSSRNVDAGSQPSTTDVRLEIEQNVRTSGPLGIMLQSYDTISLTITYTAGGGGTSATGGQNLITTEND